MTQPPERWRELLAGLTLPQARTSQPQVFVAIGSEADARLLAKHLGEFFPLSVVDIAGEVGTLGAADLAEILNALAASGVCPFVPAGGDPPENLTNLGALGVPVRLLWLLDLSRGLPNAAMVMGMKAAAARLGVAEYYLVDVSKDLYPQIFSLPFLPGMKR